VKLAACIIAKNEEKNLPRLLKSLKGKFDEVVLVDTGSTDRTVEIAESFGCKVVSHPWRGFADARNRAVSEVSIDADWLWHFDADFELEEEEFKKALVYLKRYLNSPFDGLLIGVKNYSKSGEVKALSSHIFIHRPGIEWEGSVHECPRVKRVAGIPVYVNHYGYADFKVQIEKARRNYALLKEEIKALKRGTKPYAIKLFYLIQTATILGYEEPAYLKEVKEYGGEFFELIEGREEEFGFFSVYAYNYLISALSVLGEEEEVERWLEEVLKRELPVPDFYLKAFTFYDGRGDVKKAFDSLKRLAELYDTLEDDPFSFGIAFASDRVEAFKNLLLTYDFSKFRLYADEVKNWGEGKYKRALTALLLPVEKRFKLLAKLTLRHREEELFPKLLIKEAFKFDRFKEVASLVKRVKGAPSYYILAGALKEREGKFKEAAHLYARYLALKKEPFIAARLLEVAKKSGLTSDIV